MSQKSQTRFVVDFGSQLRRILSIRQRGNDDLNVTLHINGAVELCADGHPKVIKECRYSIHVTPGSDSNTIKGTTEHTDGTSAFRHLSTYALRDGRLQPVFVRSLSDPAILPLLDPSAKGSIVRLPAYDRRLCTMYYALWICARDVADTNPMHGPYSLVRWDYRQFTVFMPFCYAPKPTPPGCKTWELGTTTEEHRTAEHAALNCHVGPGEGVVPRSAAGTMIWLFNNLIAVPLVPPKLGLQPDEMPPLGFHTPNFAALPNDCNYFAR